MTTRYRPNSEQIFDRQGRIIGRWIEVADERRNGYRYAIQVNVNYRRPTPFTDYRTIEFTGQREKVESSIRHFHEINHDLEEDGDR